MKRFKEIEIEVDIIVYRIINYFKMENKNKTCQRCDKEIKLHTVQHCETCNDINKLCYVCLGIQYIDIVDLLLWKYNCKKCELQGKINTRYICTSCAKPCGRIRLEHELDSPIKKIKKTKLRGTCLPCAKLIHELNTNDIFNPRKSLCTITV